MRHYQMWHRHGDALFADKKRVEGLPPGQHKRRGYLMESPVIDIPKAAPSSASTEKSDRHHRQAFDARGLRDGTKRSRREWKHRKLVGATPGQVVHHIDLDPMNNDLLNLHVFASAKEHGAAHRSLELAAAEFLAMGLIEFDRESGLYRRRQEDVAQAIS